MKLSRPLSRHPSPVSVRSVKCQQTSYLGGGSPLLQPHFQVGGKSLLGQPIAFYVRPEGNVY